MRLDFHTLYRTHYGRVYGLCLRLLGGQAQAEDAAQEVFVRAYQALGRYDDRQPFAAWVLGIASNHCIDLIRRRAREAGLFDDAEHATSSSETEGPNGAEALIGAEREAEVRAAIAALPDRYRVPIVLAYYSEWSYDDIATQLGITRNHVGVLLLRARQSLRRALTDRKELEP